MQGTTNVGACELKAQMERPPEPRQPSREAMPAGSFPSAFSLSFDGPRSSISKHITGVGALFSLQLVALFGSLLGRTKVFGSVVDVPRRALFVPIPSPRPPFPEEPRPSPWSQAIAAPTPYRRSSPPRIPPGPTGDLQNFLMPAVRRIRTRKEKWCVKILDRPRCPPMRLMARGQGSIGMLAFSRDSPESMS